MASQTQMPLQVLMPGDVREFPARDGRPAQKVRNLQCFTGDVVGQLPYYLRDDVDDIVSAGHYMATIEWSNYQGRLTPRIVGLVPRKNVNPEAPQK
jgi:hypothetical protein